MKAKKIILSAFTILAFAFYIVYQRLGWGSSVVVTPDSSGQNPSSTAQNPSIGNYRDGVYSGVSADAFYGRVEVVATISKGRIVDVTFLDHPKDAQTSREISAQAMPLLQTEAITAQTANVDIVSGATETSLAFKESLASALVKAKL
jgi:uncharacterized protein with FMN-binding domain